MVSPPLARTSASVAKSSGGQTGSSMKHRRGVPADHARTLIAAVAIQRTVHVDHQRNAGTDGLRAPQTCGTVVSCNLIAL
jgi:hypothetical protein